MADHADNPFEPPACLGGGPKYLPALLAFDAERQPRLEEAARWLVLEACKRGLAEGWADPAAVFQLLTHAWEQASQPFLAGPASPASTASAVQSTQERQMIVAARWLVSTAGAHALANDRGDPADAIRLLIDARETARELFFNANPPADLARIVRAVIENKSCWP